MPTMRAIIATTPDVFAMHVLYISAAREAVDGVG
jgi:hypothetical protein